MRTPVLMEPSLKYHPGMFEVLTQVRNPDRGHCVVGSLTGAVSAQRVTEEHEGALSMVGNHAKSVKAKARLTARQTRRAGTKVGLSDPVVLYGRAIAQRIKGTTGITGRYCLTVHIVGGVWQLDDGSSHAAAVVSLQGIAVRTVQW